MRIALLLFILVLFGACASIPTMRSTIGEAFGEQINVTKVKTLCKMPPGTPITDKYVFLGCDPQQIPIVLDLVCQDQKTITSSCAYPLEAFRGLNQQAAATP